MILPRIKRYIRNAIPDNPARRINSLDFLISGIFIYTFTNSILMFFLPQFMWWVLDFIAVCFFFYGLITVRKRPPSRPDITLCAVLLLFYALIILFIGIFNPKFNLPHVITNQHYVLPYLLPLLLFVELRSDDIQKLYKYLYLGSFLAFIFCLFNAYSFIFDTANATSEMYGNADDAIWGGIYFYLTKVTVGMTYIAPISIFYMSGNCKNRSHEVLIAALIFLTILMSMSFGRRGASLFALIYFLSPLVLYSICGKHKVRNILLISLIVTTIYSVFFWVISMFPILEGRLDSDSRSGLFSDFAKSFDEFDWIFGKGLDGTYSTSEDGMGERSIIENMYLDIILRTGLIYLIPYVYIIFVSIIKSIYVAKSKLIKGAGVYLVIVLIQMALGGCQRFILADMMVFFCVSLCCSKKVPKLIVNH